MTDVCIRSIVNANDLRLHLRQKSNRSERNGGFMKKYLVTVIIIITGLLAAACGPRREDASIKSTEALTDLETTPVKTPGNSEKLEVYTSFYPLYDFAVKIGGDKVKVINLVPAGTEPHDWEPATTDILSLEKADMLIYNGVGMEHWVDQVSASLENKNLILLEASNGITLLEGGEHEDEHADEDALKDEHDGEKDEHTDEDEKIGAHKGFDPHVWLSIKNAKKEMENIKDAFVKADPDNKDFYEANYEKYAAEFDAMDLKFNKELSGLTNKDLIVAHQAFAYLCTDYGLKQVAIEGLAADSEPDAKRMAEIIDFARDKEIKTIFFEELVNPKVAETIAAEIGAQTDVLNPLEGLTQEQLNAGEDYLSIMEKNLKALVSALK